MPRLIDADKAKEVITYYYSIHTNIQRIVLEEAFSRVPTVDAVPLEDFKSMERTVNKLTKAIADAELVRHGHWEVVDETEPRRYGCSACKRLSWTEDNYCPNCGAKMDEEKENDTQI